MILVAGGTGHLGRLVVGELLDAGRAVRVMAKGAASATDLAERGAQLYAGDVRDARSVRSAMQGVSVCVSAVQGMGGTGGVTPATVDRDGNRHLVDSAAEAGAAVVMVSLLPVAPDSPVELFRMKWAAEQYLRASGLPWTIVRAAAFAEVWGEMLRGTTKGSGRLLVFGRGENPNNFVSIHDVATAVVHAVTDESLRGVVLEVGGPENLTLNEFARRVRPGQEPRHLPRTVLRLMGAVAGVVRPEMARLAHAALHMDTAPAAFDPKPTLTAHPWMTSRPITTASLQP